MVNIESGLAINTSVAADRTSAGGLRRALAGAAFWSDSVPGQARPGLFVSGGNPLLVASASSSALTFSVAAGYAMVSRAAAPSLGSYVVGTNAAVSITLSAANASNPRIDAVYICQPDPEAGDSTHARIDVVVGTAAASPTAPADALLPAGSIRLANILVPAAATAASSCTITDVRVFTGLNNTPPVYATTAALPASAGFGAEAVVQSASGLAANSLWRYQGAWQLWDGDGTPGIGFAGTVVNAGTSAPTTIVRSGRTVTLDMNINTGANGLSQGGVIMSFPSSMALPTPNQTHWFTAMIGYGNAYGVGFFYVAGSNVYFYQYVPTGGGAIQGAVGANVQILGSTSFRAA